MDFCAEPHSVPIVTFCFEARKLEIVYSEGWFLRGLYALFRLTPGYSRLPELKLSRRLGEKCRVMRGPWKLIFELFFRETVKESVVSGRNKFAETSIGRYVSMDATREEPRLTEGIAFNESRNYLLNGMLISLLEM